MRLNFLHLGCYSLVTLFDAWMGGFSRWAIRISLGRRNVFSHVEKIITMCKRNFYSCKVENFERTNIMMMILILLIGRPMWNIGSDARILCGCRLFRQTTISFIQLRTQLLIRKRGFLNFCNYGCMDVRSQGDRRNLT